MINIINKGAKSHLPFSPAIQAGDFLYVSGQASVDRETGAIISGTFEEEVRRSIDNIKIILESADLSLDHVINVKSYLANENDLESYNSIYAEYFNQPAPTRSTIVSVLPSFIKFEIDCIAYSPQTRQEG